MKSIEERLTALEDEAAIRNLAAAFADACMIADYQAFEKLWSEKSKWTIHQPVFSAAEGRPQIREMMHTLRERKAFFVQFVHSGIIKVDGNKASARWIMQEAAEGPAEFYYDNYAVYMDTLEKHGDQWFFASRDYHYMWLNTHPFPGDVFDLPAEGTNGI